MIGFFRIPQLIAAAQSGFAVMLLATSAHADLVWENPVQEFQRLPEDKELAVDFAYHNTGTESVTIMKVTPSCGSCSTVTVPEEAIQPGQRGVLPVKFTLTGRRGMQSKSFTVLTDDRKTTDLILKCHIVDAPLTLTPAALTWKVGEPAAARQVAISLAQREQIQITAVASTSPAFTVTMVGEAAASGASASTAAAPGTGAGTGKFLLSIVPSHTAQAAQGDIIIQTNFPPDGPRAYTVRATVK